MSDGELLTPVAAPESGLRSERRLSHAYFLDLPGRPNGMLVADAQLNVVPNLAAKKDIVANTIDLAPRDRHRHAERGAARCDGLRDACLSSRPPTRRR